MGVATRIREAERNRPAALRGSAGDPAAAAPPPPSPSAADVTLIGRTLMPDEVAAETIAAMRAGELYVITHEEGLPPLRRRFERLERAIQRRARV